MTIPVPIFFITDEKSRSLTLSPESTTLDSSISYDRRYPLDSSFKFKAYVDFTKFYENVEKARKEGTLTDDFDFDL